MFVGLEKGVKGFKVWVPSKHKFMTVHNVEFQENVFPYLASKSSTKEVPMPNIVPSSTTSKDAVEFTMDDDDSVPVQEEEESVDNESSVDDEYFTDVGSVIDDAEIVQPAVTPEPVIRRSERTRTVKTCKVCADCSLAMFIQECDCLYMPDPKNVSEAMNSPHATQWLQSMKEEMDQLRSKNVFEVVDRPRDQMVLGTKWVFKVKMNQEGQVERFKSRFVARGFTQVQGVNLCSSSQEENCQIVMGNCCIGRVGGISS